MSNHFLQKKREKKWEKVRRRNEQCLFGKKDEVQMILKNFFSQFEKSHLPLTMPLQCVFDEFQDSKTGFFYYITFIIVELSTKQHQFRKYSYKLLENFVFQGKNYDFYL